jgi:hypothetical protein
MTDIHPRELILEKFSNGEISGTAIEAHIAGCPRCAAFVQQVQKNHRDFLARHPFAEFARENLPAPGQSERTWWQTLMQPAFAPVFAVIVASLVALPVFIHFKSSDRPAPIAYKGGDGVSFLLKRNGVVTPGNQADTFACGDEIQVVYATGHSGFITLVSIDNRGTVSFYAPDTMSGLASIATQAGNSQFYPASIVLDSSRDAEVVVALFSPKQQTIDAVRRTIVRHIGGQPVDIDAFRRSLQQSYSRVDVLILNKR